jgi:ferredoxin
LTRADCYTERVREFVTDERLAGISGPSASLNDSFPCLGRRKQAMTYVITEPCIGTKDASCVEVCPVDCIHSDDAADQYFINPDECIDCGVCAEVCPVEAIFFEDDVPEQWAKFIPVNKSYFDK